MPEILEVELYRRALAPMVGRTISSVAADDDWYLKATDAPSLVAAIGGARIESLRRRGKLLSIDVSSGHVVGLHFGMTGRPILDDGEAPFELEYSSSRALPEWDRFALGFTGGGSLRINDPRRLGGVQLDPDESALGPDAFELTLVHLRSALDRSIAVKAALMDQARLAGLGNMLADEVLWRVGTDPARPAEEVVAVPADLRRLHRAIVRTLPELLERGGSHAGDLAVELRTRGATCPRDGTPLQRRTIGGRTTFSCPAHQR